MRYSDELISLSTRAAASIVFLAATAVWVNAQAAPVRPAIVANSSGPFSDAIERRNREFALRNIKPEPLDRKTEERISPVVLKQLNEDFKQIQIVRLKLVNVIRDHGEFDYKRLSDDSDEIRKRAARLRSYLADAEKARSDIKQSGRVVDKAGVNDAVAELCLEISRFMDNAIFRNRGVYKASDAIEAARTLDLVIDLSRSLKNSAEKLSRSN
jgi:hypothetical protein